MVMFRQVLFISYQKQKKPPEKTSDIYWRVATMCISGSCYMLNIISPIWQSFYPSTHKALAYAKRPTRCATQWIAAGTKKNYQTIDFMHGKSRAVCSGGKQPTEEASVHVWAGQWHQKDSGSVQGRVITAINGIDYKLPTCWRYFLICDRKIILNEPQDIMKCLGFLFWNLHGAF